MNKKHMSMLLSRKFDDFLSTIDDPEVQKAVRKGTIITGGCFVSMLTNDQVNDFDLYFKDFETTRMVAEYFVKKFKDAHPSASVSVVEREYVHKPTRVVLLFQRGSGGDAGESLDDPQDIDEEAYGIEPEKEEDKTAEKPRYRPVYLTANAITLSDKIQLVIRFYGAPQEIHDNYDFVHCTCYWTSWERKVVLPADALESIITKQLKYIGSLYPVCSVLRSRKFIQRGWTINAGQYVKMLWQVSKLDLSDTNVLEDQLIGVDSAYFRSVVHDMAEKKKKMEEEDPGTMFTISTEWLFEVLDRIF